MYLLSNFARGMIAGYEFDGEHPEIVDSEEYMNGFVAGMDEKCFSG